MPRRRHDDDDNLHLPPGEYSNPVDRYAQLPEQTRQWLEHLRPSDFREMEEALEFSRSVKSGGRLLKWLIASSIAILILMSQFGEALQKAWHVFTGGRVS